MFESMGVSFTDPDAGKEESNVEEFSSGKGVLHLLGLKGISSLAGEAASSC
jgi:hypothetical protein